MSVQQQRALDSIVNVMRWKDADADPAQLLTREWLVTNGLGGYASTSVSGACTRRYHGLLVSVFPPPLGRVVMLSHFGEEVVLPDESVVDFGSDGFSEDQIELHSAQYLIEFRLDAGLPVWRYQIHGCVIEKRVLMPHRQNTVYVTYRVVSNEGWLRLRLRPSMHFREHDASVATKFTRPYRVTALGDRYEILAPGVPPLRIFLRGPQSGFVLDGGRFKTGFYRVEQSRGYDSQGPLWMPGYLRATMKPGDAFTVIASTEPWDRVLALDPDDAYARELERRQKLIDAAHPSLQSGWVTELVLAADQFLITPSTRIAEAARAQASGDDVRTVVAGYHWFTDWGRDTMISLEGLTLATGRPTEAGYILRTFSHYIRDGLIPNMFPEHGRNGLYHTADATLWYFHAIERYVAATGDRETLRRLLPYLADIIDHHLQGTKFGIGVDATDGLLRQGQDGYQLTWMDAKVGDWVVTPRRGKAVEINALWYNALKLMEGWVREESGENESAPYAKLSERTFQSFNGRFWYEAGGYLYDVVDGETGDDAALRPNQILSLSLSHPVLEHSRWTSVLETVRRTMLTPLGLRSLAPGQPDYKSRYYGDLRARDAAYHQGTVWAWLIGPFIDAWLRVRPKEREAARLFLHDFAGHLREACLGSISEIFDAEEPFHPRGCIAQAWSVAEVLRSWVRTA